MEIWVLQKLRESYLLTSSAQGKRMENTIYSKHLIVPDDSKRQKKKKVMLEKSVIFFK